MSGLTIYLLTCIPFTLIFGWLVWHEGGKDIRRHNPVWTVFGGLVFGVCWPAVVALTALVWTTSKLGEWGDAYARRHP